MYPLFLALTSLTVAALERLRPARPAQPFLRPAFFADLTHLVFNGHLLGVILAGLAARWILPPVDAALRAAHLYAPLHRASAAGLPLWVQILLAIVVIDFLQWNVHRLLHRVPILWSLHKVHHSVADGEMDWMASFRFQWTEVVVYKAALYLPLVWLGFGEEALFAHALVGTVVGHLNHANLDVDWGPGRYVLNGPRMHLWHHAYTQAEGAPREGCNFGIVLSVWDWIFGTARLPATPPARIGFPGMEEVPSGFLSQVAYQIRAPRLWRAGAGGALLAAGWLLSAAGG